MGEGLGAEAGRFDFVLANPPFNGNAVDKERLKDMVGPGCRFPFGLPRTNNANYLWIQLLYSPLKNGEAGTSGGRPAFVMANSASDARSSEQELGRQFIESRALDRMVAVGPNLFYIVTLTKLVSPMLTLCQQLRSQIQNLRRTRGLRLPRLLSGQVNLQENKRTIMSTPTTPVPPPRPAPPARATTTTPPAQKCLFQNESDWRELKPHGSDESNKAAEQATRMLKERLGSLLLSQNLLLLFGSGASVAEGGPSMSALWDEAADSQKTVLAEICDVVGHPKDKKDIEALLSRCQGALAFAPAKATIIKAFIEAVEGIIRDRCRKIETWEKVKGTKQTILQVITPHSMLLSRVVPRRQDLPRTRVFTTNYDVCLELAAKERRMPILDGFDLITPRTFDGRWFDYDFVRRSTREGAPDYLESVFHLYKLHGSVDWHRSPEGIIRDPETKKPYLIYPRDEKFAQSFEQPFLEMMSRFQMALREKDTALLLIGFGFNDHHLNQPIYHALATNPNLKLLVVDYSSEAKLAPDQPWDTLYRLQQSGAPLDVLQMDFQEFPALLPTYSEARASNTQERAAQLLKVLSSKP